MPTTTKTKKTTQSPADSKKNILGSQQAEAKTVRKSKAPEMASSRTSISTPKNSEVQTPRHAANASQHSEERQKMIEAAAYFIAEKDGFQAGRDEDYWYQAVAQVDTLLSSPAPIADKH